MTSAKDDTTMRTPTAASRGGASRGVYVHVPFCRRRCPYCDFAFEVRPADPRYAPAVVDELRARAAELGGSAQTVSFGGGTPSALPAADLVHIVDGVRATTGLEQSAEVALELNPEDVTPEYARALADGGFTRASLGVQSFDDDVLRYLGRAHDGARARDAVRACLDAGLRVGVDLIVGVPAERDGRLERDVGVLRDLGVGHVSAYILTLEEGTPLVQLIAKGARQNIDDDAQADAYERVQTLLSGAGWPQYEISSYARPGEESGHNRLYWQGGAYLGVGPSAHSMRRRDDGTVVRRNTTARLDAWLPCSHDAAHSEEQLAPAEAFLEAVAFGLRDMAAGVNVDALAARHHLRSGEPVHQELARHDGLVVRSERAQQTWHLTPRGARFADRVARAILATDLPDLPAT